MTFQNICSSMADFRAVVSVLSFSPTNKGKNLRGCVEKANRQWAFVAVWLSSYVNIKTAAAFANWLAPKKDALFSLIYFFGSFCIYYIPHNYTIPQVMPHAIPQTHSAFYPHRTQSCYHYWSLSVLDIIRRVLNNSLILTQNFSVNS